MRKEYKILVSVITIVVIVILIVIAIFRLNNENHNFNGERAYTDVKFQVDLGPRTMGSQAHDLVTKWIISDLLNQKWMVDTQEAVTSGVAIKNIIAKRGFGTPWIIIGSHYDSRSYADKDPTPQNWKLPVPGANDGASSVAVLLELARVLPNNLDKQIWLVFFDAETNGNAFGTGWDLGSEYFVSALSGLPDSVIILDMIGDKDLDIYMEGNSNPDINNEIWSVATELGYSQFIPKYKYNLIDDHTPFLNAGIRAVDVIDFDFPYYHTVEDTTDKVSAESLQVVGDTIMKWLELYPK